MGFRGEQKDMKSFLGHKSQNYKVCAPNFRAYSSCVPFSLERCVDLQVWSLDQQLQYHLRTRERCKFPGFTLDLLNQNV